MMYEDDVLQGFSNLACFLALSLAMTAVHQQSHEFLLLCWAPVTHSSRQVAPFSHMVLTSLGSLLCSLHSEENYKRLLVALKLWNLQVYHNSNLQSQNHRITEW